MINEQTLELYVYVDGINDVPFLSNDYQEYILSNGEQFVTSDGKVFNVRILNENIVIHAFTYNAKRMGSAPTITTTIKYPQCLDELFSQKVYATFNGEKYFLVATPSSSYSAEDIMYKHEATFVSERIALENTYYYDVVPENEEADEPVSNNSDFVLSMDIDTFATRMNYSLQYAGLQVVDENGEYVSGYKVEVDDGITSEEKFMSVENKFFSEVLQEVYNTFDLPYYFVGKEIHIGYSTNAINEVFRYGDSDALVSISKNNTNNRIINRATGIGSEENIPYYYPNISPKGDIKAIASTENIGIQTNDINIIDYEKFAKNIELDEVVRYVAIPQEFDIDFYTIWNEGVWSDENSISRAIFPEGNTYTLNFDFSNTRKGLGGTGLVPEELPHYYDWSLANMSTTKGFIPTLDCTSKIWDKGFEQTYEPPFNIKSVKVLWITEKTNKYEVKKILTGINGETIEFFVTKTDFYIDKIIELERNIDGVYLFPDFSSATESTRIRVVWELDLDNAAHYELTASINLPPSGYEWEYDNRYVKLEDIGLSVLSTPKVGDEIMQVLSENGWIKPQPTLMPPIYRESLGAQRFYDAISGVHIIPDENGLDSGLKYEFENEYNGHNPKEQIVQFEEIKPTIKEMRNSENLRIDMFSEIAFDENDNDEMYEAPDGTMKYKHPLFFAKLRKLDFNLFDSAIDSGEMTFAMTDGSCSACEFKVAVDKDSKKNTVQVDENGNLVRYHNDEDPNDERNGDVICGDEDRQVEVDPQDIQQDTINNEVWIALYKDKDTFGEIMPSVQHNLAPKACSTPTENDGDTFVILHISLPQRYIEYAEKQLEQQIIYFIYDNNREKFNFSIKFSRIYFAEHPEILALLDENARITVEYNDIETQLYVSSITYKTTENDILPEITVELKDEITVSQNQVQKATNQLKSELYRTLYGIDVIAQGARVFLRKDQPDTATQPITFKSNTNLDGGATVDKKIASKDYFEGVKGLSIHKDKNNDWHIETDYLHARKKFTAKEVEIQKVYHISGAQIKSSASLICSRVDDIGDSYRCWFETNDSDGNTIYNQFIVGDQAYVRTFNLINDGNGNTTNHFYWRLVTAVDNDSIVLSKTICAEGSTAPMVGDHIVQLGYQGEDRPERQVAVIDAGAGEGAPYYRQYVGINSFALPEPETQLKPNNNILTGRVTMEAGSNGLENFDEWESKQNEIDYSRDYIDNVLPNTIDELRAQIDGQVESYFEDYDPTLENYPASEWTTDELKEAHIGDTFTNTQVYVDDETTPNAGKSWRWLNKDGVYGWYAISDTDALKALALAQQAKDTADGKRRVFTTTPYAPYDEGDLWAGGSGSSLMCCIKSRLSGGYDATEWALADSSDSTKTVIDNGIVTTGTIQLGDSDTTAKAGITGSGTSDTSVRIWAGDGVGNKDNAPFRVTQDGTMYASKGEFKGSINVNNGVFSVDETGKVVATNAEIKGTVNANSGSFNNGVFTNVSIIGSVSQPFSKYGKTYILIRYTDDDGTTGEVWFAACRDASNDIVLNGENYYHWQNDEYRDLYTKFEEPNLKNEEEKKVFSKDGDQWINLEVKDYVPAIGIDADNDGLNKHDNISLTVAEQLDITSEDLSWSTKNSGRLIRIANTALLGENSQGKITLTAPDGKYFYEDGEKYSTLTISREIIEIIGLGTEKNFFGWAVLNRKDIETLCSYGSTPKVLYQGVIRNGKIDKFWTPFFHRGGINNSTILPQYTTNGVVILPIPENTYRGLEDTTNWDVLCTNAVVKAKNYDATNKTVRFQVSALTDANYIMFQLISTADWYKMD